MFSRYSKSRDVLIAGIVTALLLIPLLFEISFFSFNTTEVMSTMLNLISVFFGFIITIITILFMFNPSENSIFKKLSKDGIYRQIFDRFFDTLVVYFFIIIFLLISNLYYFEKTFVLFKISISSTFIMNFFLLFGIILAIIRLYRCLNMLNLVYLGKQHKDD